MNVTPEEIREHADWHIARAKEHEAIAKENDADARQHRAMAEKLMMQTASEPRTASAQPTTNGANITLADLETALTLKKGRITHLAGRLHTTEATIETLLALPACRFEVGNRGFIYPKPQG
jgi:outer membrane protein TolC